MHFTVLTLFPEMFIPLQESILKRAQNAGFMSVSLVNFRDYALSKHKNVDDVPYGGGAGMVLKPEPIYTAVRNLPQTVGLRKVILLTPQGKVFRQSMAQEWSECAEIVLICGHYEGFDERIRELADEEVSLGDFVLTGGEPAAMVIIDAVTRLIPGVLGEAASYLEDSYSDGLLEYPQYTRPMEFEGKRVPDILISGHHAHINTWRRKEALRRTFLRRPDLVQHIKLEPSDYLSLEELAEENTAIAAWKEMWQHLRPIPKRRRSSRRNLDG